MISLAELCAGPSGTSDAAERARRQDPRRRFADLLIASTALATQLPLVARHAEDFVGLERLLTIVEI